jgi:hypothetical protein
MTQKKQILARVWPMARDKQVTPSIQPKFFITLFVAFHEGDMLPFSKIILQ